MGFWWNVMVSQCNSEVSPERDPSTCSFTWFTANHPDSILFFGTAICWISPTLPDIFSWHQKPHQPKHPMGFFGISATMDDKWRSGPQAWFLLTPRPLTSLTTPGSQGSSSARRVCNESTNGSHVLSHILKKMFFFEAPCNQFSWDGHFWRWCNFACKMS